MSTHLSREELVEHLDGALDAERRTHLAACARCGREADALAAMLGEARGVDVPEPSPLFWDQFSARVRTAIDAAPADAKSSWAARAPFRRPRRVRLVFAGGLVAAALIAMIRLSRAPDAPPPTLAGRDETASTAPALDADPEWALFVSVADDLDWETAGEAGLGVRPGAAERAALQLSQEDQIELARLLRAELRRPRS